MRLSRRIRTLRKVDEGVMANFIVEYPDDDQAHYLDEEDYSTLLDAEEGSWYVHETADGDED